MKKTIFFLPKALFGGFPFHMLFAFHNRYIWGFPNLAGLYMVVKKVEREKMSLSTPFHSFPLLSTFWAKCGKETQKWKGVEIELFALFPRVGFLLSSLESKY